MSDTEESFPSCFGFEPRYTEAELRERRRRRDEQQHAAAAAAVPVEADDDRHQNRRERELQDRADGAVCK